MISNGEAPSSRPNRLRTTAAAGPASSPRTETKARPRRRYSKKKLLTLGCVFVLIFFAFRGSEVTATQVSGTTIDREPGTTTMASKPPPALLNAKEPVTEKEVPPVIDCKVYPYKHYSKQLKDKLPAYKSMSLQAGIKPIKDEDALYSMIAKGSAKLVRVEDDDALYVAPMDHGKPYLKREAHQVLRSIAGDFKQRISETDLAHARLKVTSLLRTSKDQKDLGRSNVNATRDADAPHTHGTSMDISYMKFVDKAGAPLELSGCQQVFLAETLAEVITEHRKQDPMIFAIRERQQACYHLTVCR